MLHFSLSSDHSNIIQSAHYPLQRKTLYFFYLSQPASFFFLWKRFQTDELPIWFNTIGCIIIRLYLSTIFWLAPFGYKYWKLSWHFQTSVQTAVTGFAMTGWYSTWSYIQDYIYPIYNLYLSCPASCPSAWVPIKVKGAKNSAQFTPDAATIIVSLIISDDTVSSTGGPRY